MHKKNKNKNRSKPANPTPSTQTSSDLVPTAKETAAVVVEEKPVSLDQESESVVEATSEQVEAIVEDNDLVADAPKKPKRNKGKKKKQDEISLDEIKSTPAEDPVLVSPPGLDSEVKVKDESSVDATETKAEDENKKIEENITANVRKKKNKKKQTEHQKVEAAEQTQQIDCTHNVEEVVNKEENKIDLLNKLDVSPPDVMEPDIKQPKKKNKKKKQRHDSEKSEKADEVVICTAAFQELISSRDNEGDIKQELNVASSDDAAKNVDVKEDTIKDLIESVLLPDEIKQSEDEQINRSDESKPKKKNKKDKKQQHIRKDVEKNVAAEEQTIQQQQEPIISGDVTQELQSSENLKCSPQEATSKSKAKIAKPVEKKRKEKADPCESQVNQSDDEIPSPHISTKAILSETEMHQENICTSIDPLNEGVQSTDESARTQEVAEIEAIMKNTMQFMDNTTSTDVINPPFEKPNVATISDLAVVNIGIKSSEQTTEHDVVTPDPAQILKSDERQEKTLDKPMLALEVPVEIEKNVSILPEPYKTVEKKKKKHPKKIEVTSEKVPEYKDLVTPESEPAKEETNQTQNVDIIPNVDLTVVDTSGDVEISSLKIDDIDGPSDATPDFIHHPLATSQQFSDNNNNMIIREITSTDDKLPLPLLIATEPIIQDSGETPEPLLEQKPMESSSITFIRERSLTNEPEKTDLKSKMMEVSQDMEELRLSIERSLAELTSMEKSEQGVEKKKGEIEDLKLDTPNLAEMVSSDLKDDKQEFSKNVIETTEHLTHSKADDLTEITQSETEKQETPPMLENIQEKVSETPPASEHSGDQKNIEVKEMQPQVPARKDHKGKGKGKRKGKQEHTTQSQQTATVTETATSASSESSSKDIKKEEKEQSEQKSHSSDSNTNKGKQQGMQLGKDVNDTEEVADDPKLNTVELSFEPIEHFEDALTSSVDDVNKTFEMIANEVNNSPELTSQNPQINVIAPTEEAEAAKPKQNPVTPPKNLLGHPDIPVPSNRTDYKKEKNKPPNMRHAKVKIKDAVDIEKVEKSKQSQESQTENKRKPTSASVNNVLESFSYMTNENAEYVYKYSFRKVFIQSLCQVCRKELSQRVPCQFCSLVFYCCSKHKDEDWPQHQSLCFAVCTIVHLKEQKHIYADAKNISGQNYRLLRVQMIISCEKVLKRKLVPWEQEALLYPRLCADVACREWRQSKLADCAGCGQISYCSEHPDHLPPGHQRWCRSYALYQKLVHHQQTKGRLEPKLPTRLMAEGFRIPEKINEVLAALYDEKIDTTDTEYAALTQLATAPLTAAYCHQVASAGYSNGISKKSSFVMHIVGAELQFEADVLFKWEVFFLHLKPEVKELRVVLVSPDLNPSNLPLDLLAKVKLCDSCSAEQRRVSFSFQDNKSYYEYWCSDDFYTPDIVCAFNPSIQRSSMYNGKDTWPAAVSCILKLKTPFVISSYSIDELNRDVARIKEFSELSGVGVKSIAEPKCNPFASVRPDRNFITDDEIPLLFKNHCFSILCGV